MHTNCLEIKSTNQNICDIYERHELSIIEYNSVQNYFSFANAVQPKNQKKATACIISLIIIFTDQLVQISINHINKQQIAVSLLICKKTIHCKNSIVIEISKQFIFTNNSHFKNLKTSSNIIVNDFGDAKRHSQEYYKRLKK